MAGAAMSLLPMLLATGAVVPQADGPDVRARGVRAQEAQANAPLPGHFDRTDAALAGNSIVVPAVAMQGSGGGGAAETVADDDLASAQASQTTIEDGTDPIEAEDALIDGRRRPGVEKTLPDPIEQENPGAVNAPPPEAFYVKGVTLDVGVPDRWRITNSLCPATDRPENYLLFPNLRNVCHSILDPYHHNVIKGDRPLSKSQRPGFLKGDDWFFIFSGISDTVVEPRSFPTPAVNQTTDRPDTIDIFGKSDSLVVAQTFITSFSLLKGQTAFKPPAIEYRVTLAGQFNYASVRERRVLLVEPSFEPHRYDYFIGVQEAFVDYHLHWFDNDRFDFFSVRAGIQPINVDFRGFLFQDNQLGVRLFGNRDNNRWQFNLAAFWRLEKDTNSGLNDLTIVPRRDWVFLANAYRQDFPFVGLTSVFQFVYNRNREGTELFADKNGFPARPALIGTLKPREYDIYYLGYGFDGRIGRLNATGQFYGAFGQDFNSIFTDRLAYVQAYFGALELSYDTDFMRFRVSGLFASGDGDPYNDTEAGFDSIFENPIFAGADTSYWIRQTIPFAGGGRAVSVNGRNGILNSLRSTKEQGQSNFNNPGTILLGAGADIDVTPEIRVSANVNHLWFHKTDTLQVLRNEGSIPTDIGWDLSVAGIYRPGAIQNLVFRLSGAVLSSGDGFRDLFNQEGGGDEYYSVLFNAILTF